MRMEEVGKQRVIGRLRDSASQAWPRRLAALRRRQRKGVLQPNGQYKNVVGRLTQLLDVWQ
jgi:hypothetical protein